MQINIDKKTGILGGIIFALLAVVVGMSLTRSGHDGMAGMNHMNMEDSQSASDSKLTGADIMFLQMMIPHHQQAVDISNLALRTSEDAELLALAKDIRDGQAAEIIQMNAWLEEAGASTDPGHSMGDGMGGMLDEADMSELMAATGNEFDILWLKGMTLHHEGALHMTMMIDDAQNPEIKLFGENVVKAQSAQITQMESMIAGLS